TPGGRAWRRLAGLRWSQSIAPSGGHGGPGFKAIEEPVDNRSGGRVPRPRGPGTHCMARAHHHHVLLVEDDEDCRTAGPELLASEGYAVSVAENGQLALE